MMKKNTTPSEAEEQELFVWWLRAMGIIHHHSPSSTWTSSWAQKAKNAKMGTVKGFPDLCILLPKKQKILFVEMKRVKGGTVSEEQKTWIEALKACGAEAKICRGCDEAIEFVKSFFPHKNAKI